MDWQTGMDFPHNHNQSRAHLVPELSVCSRESSEAVLECAGMFSPNISKQLSMRNSTTVLTYEEKEASCQPKDIFDFFKGRGEGMGL